MSIQQSQLNKSRLDKFLMVLNLPLPLRGISKELLSSRNNNNILEDSLQFSVYGAVVPQIRTNIEELYYGGQTLKVANHTRPPYDNVTVNFTVDNQFNNYWLLYKWLDLINDEKNSVFDSKDLSNTPDIPLALQNKKRASNTMDLYTTNFTLYGKDEFDQNIIKFNYSKAFPVNLGSIDYNYRDPGEVETTLEFAFSQFTVELL